VDARVQAAGVADRPVGNRHHAIEVHERVGSNVNMPARIGTLMSCQPMIVSNHARSLATDVDARRTIPP
jgi:hypothetical protein